MRSLKCAFLFALAILTGQFVAFSTSADLSSEPLWAVTIEDTTATPAPVGGSTRVKFQIDNFTGRAISISGIESAAAQSGTLSVAVTPNNVRRVDSFSVLHDEELDLATTHVRAELSGLRAALKEGDILDFTLIIQGRSVPAVAHVHGG